MKKRNRREHGRILSVETMQRGSALDVDAAAGATSITVADAGDFDEDGGWLYIGAQVVQFTACDDDTGVLTLATALTTAAEQGDPVNVYDPLYGEVVDYQVALVQLDGDYDNPDPVEAEVAEGVDDLPEGDRGRAGESCTLHRIADDEWEIIGVGGRPRKARSLRFEADDTYTLTSGDVTLGSAVLPLSHRPIDEALTCVLAGVPQRPTEWAIDYDAQTLTMPLDGWEMAGDKLWAHYAYRQGLATATLPPAAVPFVLHGVTYAGTTTLSTVAMPTGTVVGDLLILTGISSQGGTFTVTDPRFTKVADIDTARPADASVWVGRATSLAAVTVDGVWGGGGVAECRATLVAYAPVDAGDTLSVDMGRVVVGGQTDTSTYPLPALPGAGSGAIAVTVAAHGTGSATVTGFTGYTMDAIQGDYSHIIVGSTATAAPVPAGSVSWDGLLTMYSNTVVIGLV